jgi:hypothetical protein
MANGNMGLTTAINQLINFNYCNIDFNDGGEGIVFDS